MGGLQLQLFKGNYQLTFKLSFFILCLTLFMACCALGVWQLHRYHFKKGLLADYHARMKLPPQLFLPLSETIPLSRLQYQPIKVTGEYRNDLTMLIQNKVKDNIVGYEVVTPLQIQGTKKLLLIDRGWINETMALNNPIGNQQVIGYIKLLNEYQYILGNNILQQNTKPIIIQKVDINDITQLTQKTYYPYIVHLKQNDEAVMTTIMPSRHMGYAVQWFIFALIAFIGYIVVSFQRVGAYDK